MKQFNFPVSKEVKNILVVRQHNQIGDLLCSLPLYAALKKKYPGALITLAAAKTNYEIPFHDIIPYLDDVIIFDKSNLKTIFDFYLKLRKRKYQIGIVPSTIKVSRTSHLINFLSGAKLRIGVKSIDGIINKSLHLLNMKSAFEWKIVHQGERNLDVVRQIGCDLTKEEKRSLKINFGEDEIKETQKFLAENFPDSSRKIIGFHPGAGKIANIWDTRKFIDLIKKLFFKYNNYILITSGWKDELIIKDIRTALNNSDIKYSVVHNLPVKQLAYLLSQLNLYITNDTGTMHIAGYTETRMISLFGPTDPDEWAPTGEKKYYVRSKTENINDITVDEVCNLSEKILKEE
ncbi:MAG: glycosyltransferase family 9 protein [Ignavibacteriales bacterium]